VICKAARIRSYLLLLGQRERLPSFPPSLRSKAGPLLTLSSAATTQGVALRCRSPGLFELSPLFSNAQGRRGDIPAT